MNEIVNKKRMLTLVVGLGVGAAALVFASAAISATPAQIYRDFAEHGRLTGHYSQSDLNRASKDAVLQGYGNPDVTPGLQQTLSRAGATGAESGALPFTGLDLVLMVVGGTALLLTGAGFRRLGRDRS